MNDLPDWFCPPKRTKVFCVGMHKTSTTSLANALYTLGYDLGGTFDTDAFVDGSAIEAHVLEVATERDAVQDVPWPLFYRLLDERFPGSKFILTVRDPERWIRSVVTHFARRPIATHEYIYGVPHAEGYESVLLDYYRSHNGAVRAHFADRPEDLLVMDITKGHGWSQICPFLGLPEPPFAFPRQNDSGSRRTSRYSRAIRWRVGLLTKRLGVPDPLERGVLHAEVAYASVNALSRRFDAVIPPARGPAQPESSAQLRTAIEEWLSFQIDWADRYAVDGDWDQAAERIAAGEIGPAWELIRLLVRKWTADLSDDGAGVVRPDRSSAAEPLRHLVNSGIERWDRIASNLGLSSFDPTPSRPLRRL